MKISRVQAQLTGSDILSIINEFVQLDELELKSVEIDRYVTVKGIFKKGLSVEFEGCLSVNGVKDGKIYCKFRKFKTMKIGIFRPFRSLGLKYLLDNVPVKGIESVKDEIIIDIDKVLLNVPYVAVNIQDLYVKGQYLCAEVEDVNISLEGTILKKEVEEILLDKDEEEKIVLPVNKVEDFYTSGRKTLKGKLPSETNSFAEYLFVIPDIVALIYRLLKDDRVSIKTKMIISAAVAYVAVPNDIIPNKIPFIGKIDDLAVVFFALNTIVKDVNINILLENWSGNNELIIVLRSGLDYIINFTGAKNVEKLCNAIEQLRTL